MNFQVNNENYFFGVAPDEESLLVMVDTPTGTRRVPVYVDAPELENIKLVIEDEESRETVN